MSMCSEIRRCRIPHLFYALAAVVLLQSSASLNRFVAAQGTLSFGDSLDAKSGPDENTTEQAAPEATTITEDELIEMVAGGIEANYRNLESARATLRQQIISTFSVSTSQVDNAAADSPSLDATVEKGATKEAVEVALKGDNIKVTRRGRDTEVTITRNDRRMEYKPEKKEAVIARLDPSAPSSRLQFDPRNLGMLSDNMRILDFLKGDVDASFDKANEVAEVTGLTPTGHTMTVKFSRAFGFLPIHISYIKPDGNYTRLVQIDYQRNMANGEPLWFVDSVIERNAFPFKNSRPDAPEWGQTATTEVSDIEINPKMADGEFDDPDFPDGTVVVDMYSGPDPITSVISSGLNQSNSSQ